MTSVTSPNPVEHHPLSPRRTKSGPALIGRFGRRVRLRWLLAGFAFALAGLAVAGTSTESARVDVAPDQLMPGEYIWAPEVAPAGPVVVVISLDEQRAYVYRNGLRIGVGTISSGKKGKETPTGVFTILQKQKEHYSSLYDSAPMPFMQRLTWDGVAMHAGHLPGYPASHGCVRLPYEFARKLFEVTTNGMTVIVATAAAQSAELAHPNLFSPLAMQVGGDVPRLSVSQAYRWMPEKSPEGPLTILVGTTDRLVVVVRNGIEIGRARLSITEDTPFGTRAYVMLAGDTGAPSVMVPGRPGLNWQSIGLPGQAAGAGTSLDSAAVARIRVSPDFASLVYEQMKPGTTLVITDAPVLPKAGAQPLTVIESDEAEEAGLPRDAEPDPALR